MTTTTPPDYRAQAVERSTWPRIIIEETSLPGDAVMVHDDSGPHRVRLVWDPSKSTRTQLDEYIALNIADGGRYVERTAELDRYLKAVDAVRLQDPRPEVIALWGIIEQAVARSDDPQATLVHLCDLITAEHEKIRRAA